MKISAAFSPTMCQPGTAQPATCKPLPSCIGARGEDGAGGGTGRNLRDIGGKRGGCDITQQAVSSTISEGPSSEGHGGETDSGTIPSLMLPTKAQLGGRRRPRVGLRNDEAMSEKARDLPWDPNQLGPNPNQLRSDPNQLRSDLNQLRSDPNQLGPDPNQLRSDPNQLGQYPNQLRPDPNQLQSGTQPSSDEEIDASLISVGDIDISSVGVVDFHDVDSVTWYRIIYKVDYTYHLNPSHSVPSDLPHSP